MILKIPISLDYSGDYSVITLVTINVLLSIDRCFLQLYNSYYRSVRFSPKVEMAQSLATAHLKGFRW